MAFKKDKDRRLIGVIRDNIKSGTLFNAGFYSCDELSRVVQAVIEDVQRYDSLTIVRPAERWRPSDGPVLWWILPVTEAPFVGIPGDPGWESRYTHWTPLPEPSL